MEIDIREQFCPRCGEPTENGLCRRCKMMETEAFTCDERVIHTFCPSCGAVKSNGKVWSDSDREREEVDRELALKAVHLHPDFLDGSFDLRVREISVNRSLAVIGITGTLYGYPVQGECRVGISWHKEQCDRCNRISGSYYEGIVQIRAQDRHLTPYEQEAAVRLATTIEDELLESGDRLSYISQLEETRDGVDVIVGSQHIGILIVQALINQFGGRYTTHPKLVGEKAGRALYRITYLVRLPRYRHGDVIDVAGQYFQVQSSEGKRLQVTDLLNGKVRTIREDEISREIGNASSAIEALVVYADGGVIGLMDPDTCKTLEVPLVDWRRHRIEAGDQVRVLRDRDQLVLVG